MRSPILTHPCGFVRTKQPKRTSASHSKLRVAKPTAPADLYESSTWFKENWREISCMCVCVCVCLFLNWGAQTGGRQNSVGPVSCPPTTFEVPALKVSLPLSNRKLIHQTIKPWGQTLCVKENHAWLVSFCFPFIQNRPQRWIPNKTTHPCPETIPGPNQGKVHGSS